MFEQELIYLRFENAHDIKFVLSKVRRVSSLVWFLVFEPFVIREHCLDPSYACAHHFLLSVCERGHPATDHRLRGAQAAQLHLQLRPPHI